jgi:hypothetical protein
MYGIADLDNCYCSCEKVFRPDLEGKPIVVLSNNDGCVVARSNEAKKMRRLDEVIDRINRMHGSETIVIGAQQYTQKNGKGKAEVFANAIKHDFRSKNPTTRWSDIIKLK